MEVIALPENRKTLSRCAESNALIDERATRNQKAEILQFYRQKVTRVGSLG
jgi:hypothetical protein